MGSQSETGAEKPIISCHSMRESHNTAIDCTSFHLTADQIARVRLPSIAVSNEQGRRTGNFYILTNHAMLKIKTALQMT